MGSEESHGNLSCHLMFPWRQILLSSSDRTGWGDQSNQTLTQLLSTENINNKYNYLNVKH